MIRITNPSDSDVAVVGAGPAGSTTAYYLARAGCRVLLLDRQQFPRDKVCGDFVGPAALVELQHLGITKLAEYKKSNVIRYAALHLDGKQMIVRAIPEVPGTPSYGRVVPRRVLDHWIIQAAADAGARILEGYRVTGFALNDDLVTLTAEREGHAVSFNTKLLIGADGSTSSIAQAIRGNAVPKRNRIISVRAYFENVEGPADQAGLYFNEESFPGFYWLFPTGRHTANVGIGMVLETLPPTHDHLREMLLRFIEEDDALRERLHHASMVGTIVGWPLTTYNPSLHLVDDRVMLVGDAAGLINPLNGEGIQYALLSGRIAASVAAECLAENDFSARRLSEYTRRVEKEVRYDFALSNTIVQLIRNRILNPVWVQALKTIVARARIDPEYAEVAGGILVGLAPARDALSWKIVSGTIEQAATGLGIEAVLSALTGSNQLIAAGMKSFRVGFELLNRTLENPVGFLEWGLGASMCTFELATQAVTHALKSAAERLPVTTSVAED